MLAMTLHPSVLTPRPDHETWTQEETLSNITDAIELTNEAPSALAQLEARIKVGRGKGKVMWEDKSENIAELQRKHNVKAGETQVADAHGWVQKGY